MYTLFPKNDTNLELMVKIKDFIRLNILYRLRDLFGLTEKSCNLLRIFEQRKSLVYFHLLKGWG